MGLALLPFLGLWIAMMVAMMLPSVVPAAVLWTPAICGTSTGPERAARMSMFLSRYLLAWAACGAVAFAALTGTGPLVTASPAAAEWLGVLIFIAAGILQPPTPEIPPSPRILERAIDRDADWEAAD
jgi:predicted metal-binding membrane protein